jgi:RNA polymerase sigma-70 factor (ECF subfamily)
MNMNPNFSKRHLTSKVYQNELIEACKRGDHQAQFQVYKLHYRSVYNACMLIVNDPVAAKDLMHESFLNAFDDIDSYSSEICFTSWLNNYIGYALISESV